MRGSAADRAGGFNATGIERTPNDRIMRLSLSTHTYIYIIYMYI